MDWTCSIILFFMALGTADASGFSLVDSNGGAAGEGVKGLLLYNGGTVCDDYFDENSAAAICRLLGIIGDSSWSSGYEWRTQNSYSIHMDDVQCSSEIWSSCTYTETHNCGHGEDVFLTCKKGFSLVNSNGGAAGEGVNGLLLYNGGTVCDDHFDENSAAAICRLLGFIGNSSWSSGNEWGTQNSYSIHMDDVQCSSEIWSSCTYTETHNCEHSEDVFLLCGIVDGGYSDFGKWSHECCGDGTQTRTRTCTNPAPANGGADCVGPATETRACSENVCPVFRLVDQNGYDVGAGDEGLLLSNGGTVCDDGFSDESADAICRELDFIGGRSWRNGNFWSSFQSSFNITLDDVRCSSGELSMCTYSFEDNCSHGEDIFLECDGVAGGDERQPGRNSIRNWPNIFGEIFDSVSDEDPDRMNLVLLQNIKYIQKYVSPECTADLQGFRDLSNPNCLIDEIFERLSSLFSSLNCSPPECSNSIWDGPEIILQKRTLLMWLDIVPVEHGKEYHYEDRNGIINYLLDNLYIHVRANDLVTLQEFLQSLRLPSLQQMYQITATCDSANSRWENDLACPWRNILDELFIMTNTHEGRSDKVKQISTSIDYNRKLELQNLQNVVEDAAMDTVSQTRENLEQFSEEIMSLMNSNFDGLADYFGALADYDNDISEADIGYIAERLDYFEKEQQRLTNELDEIAENAMITTIVSSVLDVIFAITKAAASKFSAIASIFCGNPGGFMDTWDKIDEAAAATANMARASTLVSLLEKVNEDTLLVYSGLNQNRGLLDDAQKIVVECKENLDSGADIDGIRLRFLNAYKAYAPQVSPADIARLGQGWNNVLDVIRDSLDAMTQAAASVGKGVVYATNWLEKMASLISQLTALLESRFEYQFDFMDTLAISLRAKIAKNSVQKLKNSLEEVREDPTAGSFAKKQASLISLIVSRMHTLQAVQLLCNTLEFRNAGEMPEVCTTAFESLSKSAVSDVITYFPETCLRNTLEGTYKSIPVSNTGESGTINLQDLYSGNKTIFQIPDAQWLINNGWLHKSDAEEKVFYVKGFEIFAVSLDDSSTRRLRSEITACGPAPLIKDGNERAKYKILPSQPYVFTYEENTRPCVNIETDPYQMCDNHRLGDVCISRNGYIENEYDMYPSIFSQWEIELTGLPESTDVPKFSDDRHRLFLQAKIVMCSKSHNKQITLEERKQPDTQLGARQSCSAGSYFDRQAHMWNSCPNGSHAALGGYYCQLDAVNGGWTDFNWTECSAACGGGTQTKFRTCTNPAPAYGGSDCVGEAVSNETRECNMQQCIPVDGGWSEYKPWSACSVNCGGGNQTRTRSCTNPAPAEGGAECTGKSTESRPCNNQGCPIDGGWSELVSSACSVNCGGGTLTRTRSCTNPAPANGGALCSGESLERRILSCNTHPCPINGGWSGWGSYGSCSRSCGGGYQYRYRSCTNPTPAHGGDECSGSLSDSLYCNTHTCYPTFTTALATQPGKYDDTHNNVRIWVYMASGRWIYLGYIYTPSPGYSDTSYYYNNYVSSSTDYVYCVMMDIDGDNAYLVWGIAVTVRGHDSYFYNHNEKWLSTDSGDTNSAQSYTFC